MKKVTENEFSKASQKIGMFVKPIIYELNKMFKEDENLNYIEIEPEDFPESERHRFNNSSSIQALASLFRQRHSPFENWYVTVRKGKLYAVRDKKKREKTYNIRSNQ